MCRLPALGVDTKLWACRAQWMLGGTGLALLMKLGDFPGAPRACKQPSSGLESAQQAGLGVECGFFRVQPQPTSEWRAWGSSGSSGYAGLSPGSPQPVAAASLSPQHLESSVWQGSCFISPLWLVCETPECIFC